MCFVAGLSVQDLRYLKPLVSSRHWFKSSAKLKSTKLEPIAKESTTQVQSCPQAPNCEASSGPLWALHLPGRPRGRLIGRSVAEVAKISSASRTSVHAAGEGNSQ